MSRRCRVHAEDPHAHLDTGPSWTSPRSRNARSWIAVPSVLLKRISRILPQSVRHNRDAITARLLAHIAVLASVLVFFLQPARAFQVDTGPESIIMRSRYDKPASFPHRRHQEWYGCTACHHAKDQIMTIDKCEACHNDNMKNTQLDSLRKASHLLCRNCHSNERAKGRTSAPTQCRGCHIEKAATD